MVNTSKLPPSVQKAVAQQKSKDVSTGRATVVTVSKDNYGNSVVTSARSSGGGSVAPELAVASTPEQKAINEAATTPVPITREEIVENLMQKQENIKAEQQGTEPRVVTVTGIAQTEDKTYVNYVAVPSSAIINNPIVNEMATNKIQENLNKQKEVDMQKEGEVKNATQLSDNVVSVVRLHLKADSEEQNHEVQV